MSVVIVFFFLVGPVQNLAVTGADLPFAGLGVDHQVDVATEVGRDRQGFERVVGRDGGRQGITQGKAHAHQQGPQAGEDLSEIVDHDISRRKGT